MSQDPQTIGLIEVGVSLVIFIVVYFVPTIIAFARGHYRRWQILVGNLLLGWTFFVWCYLVIIAINPGSRDVD